MATKSSTYTQQRSIKQMGVCRMNAVSYSTRRIAASVAVTNRIEFLGSTIVPVLNRPPTAVLFLSHESGDTPGHVSAIAPKKIGYKLLMAGLESL
jgi:hypothetical protein